MAPISQKLSPARPTCTV